MSSRKKTSTIIISVIIVAGIALSITEQPSEKDSEILAEIKFDAVYLENDNTVQISFEDKSNNTRSVVLEILGMDVTYHEEYIFNDKSQFIEKMYLEKITKYGWETTPVTLEIQHSKFGHFGLKTEIHTPDQTKPKIIIEGK